MDRPEAVRRFDLRTIPVRRVILLFACFVYAVFGSPTPSTVGIPEILVGFGLVAALLGGAADIVQVRRARPVWIVAGQAFLLYGLIVPLCVGLLNGNDPALIGRDMIPFLFLMLPLFMARWNGREARALSVGAAMIGLAFSARVVMPQLMQVHTIGGISSIKGLIGSGVDPLYLSIAPTVPFSAVLCLSVAGTVLYRHGIHARTGIIATVLVLLGLLPLMAMAVTLQRAGLGLSIAAVIVLAGLALYKNPRRATGPVLLLGLMALAAWPWLGDVAVVSSFTKPKWARSLL